MANILVFGDSIGQGYYDKEGGWVDRLKRFYLKEEIEREWQQSINIFNLSISGHTSKEIVKRLEKEAPPRIWGDHETIFVFPIGVNDSMIINNKTKTPVRLFQKNLKKMIKFSKNYSEKIIFIGPLPVEEEKVTPMPWGQDQSYKNSEIKKYSDTMEKACGDQGVSFLDLYEQFSKMKYHNLLHDGVHPNSKGHEVLFNTIRKHLEKYLNEES